MQDLLPSYRSEAGCNLAENPEGRLALLHSRVSIPFISELCKVTE